MAEPKPPPANRPANGCGTLLAVALVAFMLGRCSVGPSDTPTLEASAPNRFATQTEDVGSSAEPVAEPAASDGTSGEADVSTAIAAGDEASEDAPAPSPVEPVVPVSPALDRGAGGDGYTDVDGHQVASPTYAPSAPSGASARCRDGTYSFSHHRRGTCSHHGGVDDWL